MRFRCNRRICINMILFMRVRYLQIIKLSKSFQLFYFFWDRRNVMQQLKNLTYIKIQIQSIFRDLKNQFERLIPINRYNQKMIMRLSRSMKFICLNKNTIGKDYWRLMRTGFSALYPGQHKNQANVCGSKTTTTLS